MEDYNYVRPGESSICNEAYRNKYESTHPQPYNLDQLERCQANRTLSYEAFFRANQPAEGHPANDT